MCSSNPYPRELPKTQTTSLLAARFQRISPRWSAFWAPHYLEPRPRRRQSGGIAPCKGATRRRHAVRMLCMAQNPHRHQWRARCRGAGGPGCGARGRRRGLAGHRGGAWLRRPWAEAGPGRGAGRRRQGQGGPRDRPLRAKLACGDLAGGPPPTSTHSGQAHQSRPSDGRKPAGPSGARNTRGTTSRPSSAGH